MNELIDKVINNLIKTYKNDTINQLSGYLLTGEPIYLPKEMRYLDNKINRIELMDYIANVLIKDYFVRKDIKKK